MNRAIRATRFERDGLAVQGDLAGLLGLGLVVFVFIAFSPAVFNDGDTSWHLAAGRLLLDIRAVPQTDPFSFTFAGAPWTAHEWLAEVVMAGAFRLAGWPGLAVLTALAVTATFLIVGCELRRHLAATHVLVAVALLFILLAPFILARPHVLAWPLLAWWTTILIRAREAGRAPAFAAALVMLAWANLHGSFLFGLVLLGLFGLEALLLERDWVRQLAAWSLFGLVALLAALATPHGIEGLLFPLQVSGMESLAQIKEWRATSLAEDKLFLLVSAGVALLAVARRVPVPLLRLLLLALLFWMALQHVRHQAVLAIVAALLLAVPFARGLGATPAAPRERPGLAIPVAFAALLAAAALARLAVPIDQPSNATNPAEAIAAVPTALRERPVLNGYSFGGPLILAGVRPFIDGRADMYGDGFVLAYQRIVTGDIAAFRREADRREIAWTILAPDVPLVAKLDREPGWRRIHADPRAVVHARIPPAGG